MHQPISMFDALMDISLHSIVQLPPATRSIDQSNKDNGGQHLVLYTFFKSNCIYGGHNDDLV